MATTRTRRKPTIPPRCDACAGTGQVANPVHVGRKRRNVGQQEGICLGCFGTGEATDPE